MDLESPVCTLTAHRLSPTGPSTMPVPEDPVACPNCGKPVGALDLACPHCGKPLVAG